MVMLFEDYKEMPVSKLLRHVYGDDKVVFSEGNMNLEAKLYELLELHGNEQILCYIDFVYDNTNTREQFTKLAYNFSSYDFISFIKIPCIEFVVYKMLLNNYKPLLHKTSDDTFYKAVFDKTVCFNHYSRDISFEEYCKSITEKLLNRCFKTGKSDTTNQGWYYVQDCKCDRAYYNYCDEIDVAMKFNKLIELLPLYCDNTNSQIRKGVLDYNKIYDRLREITPLRE